MGTGRAECATGYCHSACSAFVCAEHFLGTVDLRKLAVIDSIPLTIPFVHGGGSDAQVYVQTINDKFVEQVQKAFPDKNAKIMVVRRCRLTPGRHLFYRFTSFGSSV